MDVNTSPEVRQKVVDWVNSKSKDLTTGLEILAETGYKPHVCANFVKNQKRSDIPAKLESQLRLYLRYYANPTSEIHQDEELEDQEVIDSKILGNIEKELQNEEYPPIVKRLLVEYSESYNCRSVFHKDLKAVGEGNSDEEVFKRKSILLFIATESARQDAYWNAFETFKADGTIPAEELFEADYTPEEKTDPEPEAGKKEKEFIMADDLETLKKQSDNWRIKISKAENRLNFQSDKKEDKPNPMPEGPKRITVEKRIAQLTAEKLHIDTKIANLK